MRPTGKSNFRNDIQGLRAIAVLSVVIFHAFAGKWIPGGFVGVDIFFVISGFLISRILFKENEQGRFTVLGFYRRRLRRLSPALFTVLLFTLVCGAFLLSPDAYVELSKTALATVFFVSNFVFEKLSDYFAGSVAYKPLLHTWSLAVEEQFYILYPPFVYLVYRFWRRAMGPLLALLALLSLGISIWSSNVHPLAAFYLAPTRAFELLTGALVALYIPQANRLGQKVRDALSLAGLLLIAASLVFIRDSMAFPGAIALVPCLGTAFVIAAGHDRVSLGGRLISFAPFVFFGDLSYSLYLWHWPILSLAQNWLMGPLPPVVATAAVFLAIAAAYASWRWIERPFINGFRDMKVITAGLASMACMAALCAVVFLNHGFPDRYSKQSRLYFAASNDFNPLRNRCHSDQGSGIPYEKSCAFGAPGATPAIAIWADSHGAELAVALGDRLGPMHSSLIEITASACPPVLGYSDVHRPGCARHNDEIVHKLTSDNRIGEVVVLANFGTYPTAQSAGFQQAFENTMRALHQAGKRIIIFDPIPVFNYDAPTALGLIYAKGGNPKSFGLPMAEYRKKNASYISLIDRVAKDTGAVVIPTSDLICRQDLCPALDDQQEVLYYNEDHLSVTGARKLAMGIPLNALVPLPPATLSDGNQSIARAQP